MNLYQNAKNQAITSFCYKDPIDLKILKSDWLRAFLPISQKPDFSRIYHSNKNTVNNTKLHYRANAEKTGNKFFENLKNPSVGPFWVIFGARIFFQKNLALPRTTSYGFLTPFQYLEEANDLTPRKCLDRRMECRTNRSYSTGLFRLPGVQKVTHFSEMG